MCVCTRAKETGQQPIGGPTFNVRQETKLMFSDCECIQYVSGRRKIETGGERHREGERKREGG